MLYEQGEYWIKIADLGDTPEIDGIINCPDVRPYIAPGENFLESAKVIDKAILFLSPGGVIMGERIGDGEYLGLSAFTKREQVFHSILMHQVVFDYMFTSTDCEWIWATIDKGNAKATRNIFGVGFPGVQDLSPRIMASMNWMDWALRSKKAGERGKLLPGPEREDKIQERMLGGYALTAEGGHEDKARKWFRRYALLNHWGELIG
jgi:hypothetical protein